MSDAQIAAFGSQIIRNRIYVRPVCERWQMMFSCCQSCYCARFFMICKCRIVGFLLFQKDIVNLRTSLPMPFKFIHANFKSTIK